MLGFESGLELGLGLGLGLPLDSAYLSGSACKYDNPDLPRYLYRRRRRRCGSGRRRRRRRRGSAQQSSTPLRDPLVDPTMSQIPSTVLALKRNATMIQNTQDRPLPRGRRTSEGDTPLHNRSLFASGLNSSPPSLSLPLPIKGDVMFQDDNLLLEEECSGSQNSKSPGSDVWEPCEGLYFGHSKTGKADIPAEP